MSSGRPWYREPEIFIALAALIVSRSAVVAGIDDASLQRAHDRAEVWPRREISMSGKKDVWAEVTRCPAQRDSTDL